METISFVSVTHSVSQSQDEMIRDRCWNEGPRVSLNFRVHSKLHTSRSQRPCRLATLHLVDHLFIITGIHNRKKRRKKIGGLFGARSAEQQQRWRRQKVRDILSVLLCQQQIDRPQQRNVAQTTKPTALPRGPTRLRCCCGHRHSYARVLQLRQRCIAAAPELD